MQSNPLHNFTLRQVLQTNLLFHSLQVRKIYRRFLKGIEDQIESGLIKALSGIAVGGTLRSLIFSSGSNKMKLTGTALGLETAVSSLYQ